MYYEFRDLDRENNRYFIKYFKNHKLKDVCGFVCMKRNINMKKKYPIKDLTEGMI